MPVKELKTVDKVALEKLNHLWNQNARRLNVTKAMAAKKAGVTRPAITNVFKGRIPISDKIGQALAELLQVPLSELHPKWAGGFRPVRYELQPHIPYFDHFTALYDFFFREQEPDTIPTVASFLATERFQDMLDAEYNKDMEKLPGNEYDFYRKLQYCALTLDSKTWFANKGDTMIIDLDNRTPAAERITLWSWEKDSFQLGYVLKRGTKKYLHNPEWDKKESLPLDDAEFIGIIRGLQFE